MLRTMRPITAAFTASLVTGLLVGGAAIAIEQQPTTITACANNKTGAMRYSSSATCRSGESPITWNQQGPKGDKGEPGTSGGLKGVLKDGDGNVLGEVVPWLGPYAAWDGTKVIQYNSLGFKHERTRSGFGYLTTDCTGFPVVAFQVGEMFTGPDGEPPYVAVPPGQEVEYYEFSLLGPSSVQTVLSFYTEVNFCTPQQLDADQVASPGFLDITFGDAVVPVATPLVAEVIVP
jgi:hypothetical protein